MLLINWFPMTWLAIDSDNDGTVRFPQLEEDRGRAGA
jgi:hypothetical protein